MRKMYKSIIGIVALGVGLSIPYHKPSNGFDHYKPQVVTTTISNARESGYTLSPEYVESIEGIAHYLAGDAQITRDVEGKLHKTVPILPPNIGSLEKALKETDTNKDRTIGRYELSGWYNKNIPPYIDERIRQL